MREAAAHAYARLDNSAAICFMSDCVHALSFFSLWKEIVSTPLGESSVSMSLEGLEVEAYREVERRARSADAPRRPRIMPCADEIHTSLFHTFAVCAAHELHSGAHRACAARPRH